MLKFLLPLIIILHTTQTFAQIEISSGFERKAAVPLDTLSVVSDLTARDATPSLVRYEGMIVFVESEGTNFQLVGGIDNTDWVEVGAGGGDVVGPSESLDSAIALFDGTTGKLLKESVLQISGSTISAPDSEIGTNIALKASNSTDAEPAGSISLEAGTNVDPTFDGSIAFLAGAAERLKILATGVIEVAQGSILNFIDSGLNYVGIRGPSTINGSYTLTLPSDPPTNGKTLVSDSTGQLEWGEASGSGFGGKNLFVDPLFDENTDNAVVYDDYLIESHGINSTGDFVTFTDVTNFQIGDRVYYVEGSVPIPGLPTNSYYYVVGRPSSYSLELSTTPGGTPIEMGGGFFSGDYTFIRTYSKAEGTGPGTRLSVSVDDTTQLAGAGSLKISYDYESMIPVIGQGVRINTKTIDLEDLGKNPILKVSVDGTSANYVSNDMRFKFYDVTNGREIIVPDSLAMIKKEMKAYEIEIPVSSNTRQINVSVHAVAGNSTGDWDLIFGTWKLDYQSTVLGFIGSDTGAIVITPTLTSSGGGAITLNTGANYIAPNFKGRRVGDRLVGVIGFRNGDGGAASGSAGTVTFNLPGYVIDESKLQSNDNNLTRVIGSYSAHTGASAFTDKTPVVANGPSIQPFFTGGNRLVNVSDVAASYGGQLEIDIPIVGWTAGAVFSTQEIDSRGTNVTATASAQSVTGGGTYYPLSNNFTESVDALAEFNPSTGIFVPKTTGKYTISVRYQWAANATGQRGIALENITASGYIPLEAANAVGAGAATTGSPSATFNLNAGSQYRLAAFQTSGGDLNITIATYSITRSITDLIKFSEYKEFDVGQVVSSAKTPAASGHWMAMSGNSRTFPPGTYQIDGYTYYGNNGSPPSYTYVQSLIAGSNGADSVSAPTDLSSLPGVTVHAGNSVGNTNGSLNSPHEWSIPFPRRLVTFTQTTTVYAVPYAQMTTATNSRVTTTLVWSRIR